MSSPFSDHGHRAEPSSSTVHEREPQAPRELVPEAEIGTRPLVAVGKTVWRAFQLMVRLRPAQVVGVSFLTMMAWGYHGELGLLRRFWPAIWQGPGSPAPRTVLIPGVPWDQELISFGAGALLVVGIPALVIKLLFKQKLSDFGLGLPPPGRRAFALWSCLLLILVLLGPFYIGAHDPQMRIVYPFYKDLHDIGSFALYELGYFLFFLAIEFMFRGFLLFGLVPHTDRREGDIRPFAVIGLLVQLLPYTAWHLGNPMAELWSTPIWGVAAGALVLVSRSIWPVAIAHWALNVWLDAACLEMI